jgi:hypothetical protein
LTDTATRHAAGCPDGKTSGRSAGGSGPDYAGLTALMDMVFEVWEAVEATGTTSEIGDLFECVIGRIASMREWTGWDGVPGKYTR